MTLMRSFTVYLMNRMLADYESAGRMRKLMCSVVMHHFPGQMTCLEFGERLADYADNSLSESDLRKFELHLDGCPNCRALQKNYAATIDLARNAAADIEIDIPTNVVDALLERARKDKGLD